MYVYVCICMYMYVYVCICMYMYVYVCVCMCMLAAGLPYVRLCVFFGRWGGVGWGGVGWGGVGWANNVQWH